MEPQQEPPGGPAETQAKSPGLGAVIGQFIEADRRKWGGMTFGASARMGLAELREAVSLKSGNEAATPYGMYGNLTPGEIGAARVEGSPFGNTVEEPAQPSPGDIAYGRDAGSVYGQAAERGQERQADGPLPSPGEIAREPNRPEPPGRENGQERGR